MPTSHHRNFHQIHYVIQKTEKIGECIRARRFIGVIVRTPRRWVGAARERAWIVHDGFLRRKPPLTITRRGCEALRHYLKSTGGLRYQVRFVLEE